MESHHQMGLVQAHWRGTCWGLHSLASERREAPGGSSRSPSHLPEFTAQLGLSLQVILASHSFPHGGAAGHSPWHCPHGLNHAWEVTVVHACCGGHCAGHLVHSICATLPSAPCGRDIYYPLSVSALGACGNPQESIKNPEAQVPPHIHI